MRKLAALFLAFSILMLSACASPKDSTDGKTESVVMPDRINALFTVEYGSFTGEGQLGYVKDLELVATMTQPQNLRGMKIVVRDDECSVSHKGITYTKDTSQFSQTVFVSMVFKALKEGENPTSVEKIENDKVKICGTCVLGDYEIIMDKSLERVEKVRIPSKSATVTLRYE